MHNIVVHQAFSKFTLWLPKNWQRDVLPTCTFPTYTIPTSTLLSRNPAVSKGIREHQIANDRILRYFLMLLVETPNCLVLGEKFDCLACQVKYFDNGKKSNTKIGWDLPPNWDFVSVRNVSFEYKSGRPINLYQAFDGTKVEVRRSTHSCNLEKSSKNILSWFLSYLSVDNL